MKQFFLLLLFSFLLLTTSFLNREERYSKVPLPTFDRPSPRLEEGGTIFHSSSARVLPTDKPTPISSIPLSYPKEIQVASPFVLKAGPINLPDQTTLFFSLTNSYGTRSYRQEIQNQFAYLILDPEETTEAGYITIHLTIPDFPNYNQQEAFTILPDDPIEPLQPLVGARSIIADGAHWAMVVVIPFDQFNNPVTDGTPIQIRALHPHNRLEDDIVPVEHLLAWKRIWSGTVAGRTAISASSNNIFGPEADLLEIPGWPTPFSVTVVGEERTADGRQLLELKTDLIQDKFGNIMPDGTEISFIISTPTGERIIPAYTIDGIAQAPLQAPFEAGTVTIYGSAFNVIGNRTTIQFSNGPAAKDFPLTLYLYRSENRFELVAGPIIGTLEQYVPDGTAVTFDLTNKEKSYELTAIVDAGYARLKRPLDFFPPGTYSVTATLGGGKGVLQLELPSLEPENE